MVSIFGHVIEHAMSILARLSAWIMNSHLGTRWYFINIKWINDISWLLNSRTQNLEIISMCLKGFVDW